MEKYYIGIDVGGTNIKIGLVNYRGQIKDRTDLITKSYIRDKNKLISALLLSIKDIFFRNKISKKNISGVGIGLPGLIDPKEGIVHILPNVPGWRNVRLKKALEKKLGLRVFIENDVNLIALAEWKYGAGKGKQNIVCITLGTGVGGGLILNNVLYSGESFAAGEIGHIPINEKGPKCTCGGWGCFERYVGNKSLEEKAAKIFKRKGIKLEEVYKLAKQGNIAAINFWQDMAKHIGNVLVGVVNLLNPKVIIIGGGIGSTFSLIKKPIEDIINARAMKVQSKTIKILKAKLGKDAGIIGAKVLVEEAVSEKK